MNPFDIIKYSAIAMVVGIIVVDWIVVIAIKRGNHDEKRNDDF